MDNDQRSLFENEDADLSDPINLAQLTRAVSEYLQQPCQLKKLGEGGYHKVYDIDRVCGPSLVVRVARPCVARDKMESEVATMKYLAGFDFPVPKIYTWVSASNAVDAEYMIMEKVSGCPVESVWDTLSLQNKEKVVKQVARHLLAAFQLRFDQAGSLYHSANTPDPYYVGPIVTSTFFEVQDGLPLYSDRHVAEGIRMFRGPFRNTAAWLSHFLRVKIFILEATRDHEFDANAALLNMEDAIRLCSIYPGEYPIIPHMKSPKQPFSFRFDDISLKNIMIDETCQITSFIDFEGTTITPLWACATVPIWLLPKDDLDGFDEGPSSFAEKETLCRTFLEEIGCSSDGQEWLDANEMGRDFRKLMYRLDYSRACGLGQRSFYLWMKDRFDWAQRHPGVPCPYTNEYHYIV